MATRRSVWSEPEIQQLLKEFVPAADEVGRLQRGRDRECLLFQAFAEQGHYKGRVVPSDTRQGIYAVTPNGTFLASCNTRRADTVAKMLRLALERWKALPAAARQLSADDRKSLQQTKRWTDRYPRDGLVLRIITRDLQGAKPGKGWRHNAWNLDFAWFRKDEIAGLLPEPRIGASRALPDPLMQRLARLHLLDNVRGQVDSFQVRDIEHARLTATVTALDDESMTLRLEGDSRAVRRGRWAVQGFRDHAAPKPQERGFAVALLGHAKVSRKTGRFTAFELIGAGERWGGTQFNGRDGDLDRGPIGVVLQLAEDKPDSRVAPARIWEYRWR
ncbi:MAG: hypothetical protein H6836_07155 [Planctomycetes bacterium]|nr:hypothetical protein [Planctomycetota bacterium]